MRESREDEDDEEERRAVSIQLAVALDMDSPRVLCPCRALWCAVLMQAIRDAQGDNEELREDAVAWLLDESEALGAFRWICFMLDLRADKVRGLIA